MATAKIMYLADYYDVPQGGTEGQLLQIIQHLNRSRYDPTLTVFRSSEYIACNPFPCPVKVLGITKLASVKTIFSIVRYAINLRREKYRLVHCFFNDSALIAPFFLRLFGIRVLVSRRDMGFWYTPLNLVVLRLIAPLVDRYVTNSQAVKRLVQQREWVRHEKITVIYNGYTPRVENCDKTSTVTVLSEVPVSVPLVGIVANLKPIKRIDTLVEAFARVGNKHLEARLVIIGDTASEEGSSTLEELEALASRLEIRGRVIFTGLVDNPMAYINRFTVAVLCSESEGFSNSLIEYMQAGRPIICTDTGGNPELVQDGHNGFLIPVGDKNALADRLGRLLSDRELAHRMGEAGNKTVRAYTHARMVTEHMTCYDEVLLAGRSRRSLGR